jgi:hypothetical protein
MEDVLDLYRQPYDAKRPMVCLDEKPVPLVADKTPPQESAPGRLRRQDYEYQRNGTANIFVTFEPLANWRDLTVTDQRTAVDWAQLVKDLVDGRYKKADKIVLVLDNLNTHTPASLYKVFEPAQAKRIADKLEIHYTPKHGSWLNMAEIELSVAGHRLPQRLGNKQALQRHCQAIARERNAAKATVDWQFRSADARIKLKRLYPSLEVL